MTKNLQTLLVEIKEKKAKRKSLLEEISKLDKETEELEAQRALYKTIDANIVDASLIVKVEASTFSWKQKQEVDSWNYLASRRNSIENQITFTKIILNWIENGGLAEIKKNDHFTRGKNTINNKYYSGITSYGSLGSAEVTVSDVKFLKDEYLSNEIVNLIDYFTELKKAWEDLHQQLEERNFKTEYVKVWENSPSWSKFQDGELDKIVIPELLKEFFD
jgi:hypothetical protein